MLATFNCLYLMHLIFCRLMKPVIRLGIFFFVVGLVNIAPAQQVQGHWFGIGNLQAGGYYQSYMSELVLRQKGKQVWGELDYYFKDSLVKAPLTGSFDEKNRKLVINPFAMIYYRSPDARNSIDARLSGNFMLVASKTGSVLTGSLTADEDHKYTVPPISYRLTRSDDTLDLVMKEEPEAEPAADTIARPAPAVPSVPTVSEPAIQRAKVYTKELEIENSSIRLEIYDNGEIDRDSISLFLNDKRVLPKSMLTHRAIRLTLQLDRSLPFNELTMFAENLGMIPPNTAALILYDGNKRYETLLTSDLSKSATLKLLWKKPSQ